MGVFSYGVVRPEILWGGEERNGTGAEEQMEMTKKPDHNFYIIVLVRGGGGGGGGVGYPPQKEVLFG